MICKAVTRRILGAARPAVEMRFRMLDWEDGLSQMFPDSYTIKTKLGSFVHHDGRQGH